MKLGYQTVKFSFALAFWLVLVAIAVVNGYVGNTYIAARFGDYIAHVYKKFLLIAAVFIMAWLYAHRTQGSGWFNAALGAGFLWFVLSIMFEFIIGHYVFGSPWDLLFADYKIW
jgi:hypothetical protein